MTVRTLTVRQEAGRQRRSRKQMKSVKKKKCELIILVVIPAAAKRTRILLKALNDCLFLERSEKRVDKYVGRKIFG